MQLQKETAQRVQTRRKAARPFPKTAVSGSDRISERSTTKSSSSPSPRTSSGSSATSKRGKARGKTETRTEDSSISQALIGEIPSLRAFANALCRDPTTADDLVQETLVRAWSHLDSFQIGTNLKAWLFTILRNTYYTEWRKRRREFTSVNGEDVERVPAVAAQPGHMHLQDFRKALQEISDDRREALILVGAGGFSYKEAAKICGCSVGTIKSRVSRARAELAGLLDIETADVD